MLTWINLIRAPGAIGLESGREIPTGVRYPADGEESGEFDLYDNQLQCEFVTALRVTEPTVSGFSQNLSRFPTSIENGGI